MTPGIQRLTTPSTEASKAASALGATNSEPGVRGAAQDSTSDPTQPAVRFDTMLAQVRLLNAGIFAQPLRVEPTKPALASEAVDRAESRVGADRERSSDRRARNEREPTSVLQESRDENSNAAADVVDSGERTPRLELTSNAVEQGLSPRETGHAVAAPDSEAATDAGKGQTASSRAAGPHAPTDPLRLITPQAGEQIEAGGESRHSGPTVGAAQSSVPTHAAARQGSQSANAEAAERSAGATSVATASVSVVAASSSATSAASVGNPGIALPGASAGGAQAGQATGASGVVGGVGISRGLSTVGQGGVRLRLAADNAEGQVADSAAKVNAQIARGLAAALKQKSGTFTMRLNPDALGSVRVELTVSGKNVSATFEASTPQAQRHMLEHADSLRSSLESHGLKVDHVHVVLQEPRGLHAAGKLESDADPRGERESGSQGQSQERARDDAQHGERRNQNDPDRPESSAGVATRMPSKLAMLDAADVLSRGPRGAAESALDNPSPILASLELDAVA